MRMIITVPWGERLGGAEGMLQGILDGAKDSGHEIELIFFRDGPWPGELRAAGLRAEVIDAGRLREGHRWLRTVLQLRRVYATRKPDLILNWSAKTHLYSAPAAMLAGMSDRLLWWQQAIPEPLGWLDRCATLLPARAVGCYSGPAAAAQKRVFPGRRTFVVNAGSPPPPPGTGPATIELPDDGIPIVGLVGRLQPWKGQDRLLRAQALLHERGQRFHMLIVGGDSWGLSPDYAASLPRLAEELGLTGSVTMTGEVPDAGPYVERMDVLVNASDPEPFGIVLLEAMARGVAVLAVNSGGPSEFLSDGETGVLARSGAPADLADGLQKLLESADLRERLAAAGRDSYLRDYTDTALQKRFYATVEDLLVNGS